MNGLFTGPAPLPVPAGDAVAVARYLRERYRFSYRDLGTIMGLYHGQFYAQDTWRKKLRGEGIAPVHYLSGEPRGYAKDKAAD